MATPTQPIAVIATELRQCFVGGRKALFHRWHEKTDVIIQFKENVTINTARYVRDNYLNMGYLNPHAYVKKITNTYAIVEFEDGTLRNDVTASEIKFLDGKEKFCGYSWDCDEAEKEILNGENYRT